MVTGFLPVFFPLPPFQLSYFWILSSLHYHAISAYPYSSKTSLTKRFSFSIELPLVRSSTGTNNANYKRVVFLYLPRSKDWRILYPSRGRRRLHCSVMPAAPHRRGMEGGKGLPCIFDNRFYGRREAHLFVLRQSDCCPPVTSNLHWSILSAVNRTGGVISD